VDVNPVPVIVGVKMQHVIYTFYVAMNAHIREDLIITIGPVWLGQQVNALGLEEIFWDFAEVIVNLICLDGQTQTNVLLQLIGNIKVVK
jgi:hypothetical protein